MCSTKDLTRVVRVDRRIFWVAAQAVVAANHEQSGSCSSSKMSKNNVFDLSGSREEGFEVRTTFLGSAQIFQILRFWNLGNFYASWVPRRIGIGGAIKQNPTCPCGISKIGASGTLRDTPKPYWRHHSAETARAPLPRGKPTKSISRRGPIP